MDAEKKDFLLHMYNQLAASITRQLNLGWQSIGIVIGSFVLLSLTEKKILPLDISVTIIVTVGIWGCNLLIDANHWYSRNLAIIRNIERQFLGYQDLREILCYFEEHRPPKIVSHIKIQLLLIASVVLVFLYFHAATTFQFKLVGSFQEILKNFATYLPYVVSVSGLFATHWFWRKRKREYIEFITLSPGKPLEPSMEK